MKISIPYTIMLAIGCAFLVAGAAVQFGLSTALFFTGGAIIFIVLAHAVETHD